MFFSTRFIAVSAIALSVSISAQTITDVQSIPKACSDSCSAVIESITLCQQDYGTSMNASAAIDVTACFCNSGLKDSDYTNCGSCLTSNGASDVGNALNAASTGCANALKTCVFECDFPTCDVKNIACQCDESYLQKIYNCGACNTANNNVGATGLSDYTALKNSCVNQNYTMTPTATEPLPSPTGQDQYKAPTLTGTGGSISTTSVSGINLGGATAAASSSAAGSSMMMSSGMSSAKSSMASSSASAGMASGSSSSAAASASVSTAKSGAEKQIVAGSFAIVAMIAGAALF